MNLRKAFLILVMFGVWASASGQSANLLKNPSGDAGAEHWRAFHDAKVEACPTGGRCFVLRGGGYFIQEVTIPAEAVGQYALLIGRAYSESPTVLPSLYGYLMNSGDPSGGRIYAYLHGQQMTGSADSSNHWTRLWGVFRVKPGTGRISFFLKQSMQRGMNTGAVTRFDDLALYILPTEHDVRRLVSWAVPGVLFGPTKAIEKIPQCWLPGVLKPSLYGIELGRTLDDVLSLFPEAINQPSVIRALEASRSPTTTGPISMVIRNRSGNQNLRDLKQILFRFHNKRLFSLTVESHSPYWKDAEEFIDQRGQMLNVLSLPKPSDWEPVDGNPKGGKYLICHGIEIRFYAAPLGSANMNLASVTDTTIETTLARAPNPQQ
ncbi:MAG: hypothetical protein ABR568_09150 [Pyrinomonadaceae bacterium]